ncbi:MAG: Gfo/Idh/MocA family oxidoreductase [Ignavibacteria bacterium]|nr:Gfo/Idh/MocA family oxidoreductase [Ignavibacteria bacterium]
MDKLSVGVIGVGHLGSLHAKMYSEISSAHLVGVTDTDAARAEKVARECSTTAFNSASDLLQHVRAVSIATPTSTHFEIAQQTIACGVHAFIEKPITTTVQEAETLARLATKKHMKIQVGHIERFNPALLALERYHLQPMFVESHRLAQFNPRGTDVAVVLDLMIHDIDIIVSLVRSPIQKVDANGVAVVSDTIDIANARLQFENGCVANVTASRISQKKMRKMRLFQRDAYISIDFSEGLAEVFHLIDGDQSTAGSTMMLGEVDIGKGKRKIVYEQPEIREVNALRYELEMFIHAVQNDAEPVVTAEDGLRALQIAHEIMATINKQRLSI